MCACTSAPLVILPMLIAYHSILHLSGKVDGGTQEVAI